MSPIRDLVENNKEILLTTSLFITTYSRGTAVKVQTKVFSDEIFLRFYSAVTQEEEREVVIDFLNARRFPGKCPTIFEEALQKTKDIRCFLLDEEDRKSCLVILQLAQLAGIIVQKSN